MLTSSLGIDITTSIPKSVHLLPNLHIDPLMSYRLRAVRYLFRTFSEEKEMFPAAESHVRLCRTKHCGAALLWP